MSHEVKPFLRRARLWETGARTGRRVRTAHGWVGAGGGEVKAGHLLVAVLLDAYELPLVHHVWPQAFNGIRV